jgi:hypothetical protein
LSAPSSISRVLKGRNLQNTRTFMFNRNQLVTVAAAALRKSN